MSGADQLGNLYGREVCDPRQRRATSRPLILDKRHKMSENEFMPTALESPLVPYDAVVPSTEFRDRGGDVLNVVAYGDNKRVAITRHGKVAAVLISVHELDLLDEIEMAADTAAYKRALADDDGTRVSHEELLAELSESDE